MTKELGGGIMKVVLDVFLMIFVCIFSVSKSYSSTACDQVLSELKQMKKAQQTVQGSLISNHDMMAESLESYSDALKVSAGKAFKTVESNMSKAALSLRERGQKAQVISDKLTSATEELINKIENCLKK